MYRNDGGKEEVAAISERDRKLNYIILPTKTFMSKSLLHTSPNTETALKIKN